MTSGNIPRTQAHIRLCVGEETRQQYANRRIREYQHEFAPGITWYELLSAFRYAGQQYDKGELAA